MSTEQDIQNKIRLELSKVGIVFRANVGKVKMKDGRWFDTGLPKGFSDLFGFRKSDGRMFFIEVKNEKGRASKEQLHFLKVMKENGALTGIARSPEDALKILEGQDD
mgnify:CR=1 FL=1